MLQADPVRSTSDAPRLSAARQRAEAEFAVSVRTSEPFATVAIVLDAPGQGPAVEQARRRFLALGRIAQELSPGPRSVVELSADRILWSLPATDLVRAGALVDQFIRWARAERSKDRARLHWNIGVACSRGTEAEQVSGLFLETLFEVAVEGAEVADAAGGDRWAHTELYALVQRRLEREGHVAPRVSVGSPPLAKPPVLQAPVPDSPAGTITPTRAPLRSVPPPDTAPPVARVVTAPVSIARASVAPSDTASVSIAKPVATSVPVPSGEVPARHLVADPNPFDVGGPFCDPPAARENDLSEPDPLGSAVFRALTHAGLDLTQARVVEQALLPHLQSEVEQACERSVRGSEARVALLERRIAKLVAELDEVESRELRRVPEEFGVASTFKAVQGLARDDERFALKSELLEAILKANLELAAHLGRGA